jgi:hypothetical protein
VADVVRDDELGLVVAADAVEVAAHVAEKADGGTHERVVVEHIAADAGVLRRTLRAELALLGGGRDHADGAAAHTAGAEFEVAVKAVVEFRPSALGDQFVDALDRPGRKSGGEPGADDFHAAGQQLAGFAGGLDLVECTHG